MLPNVEHNLVHLNLGFRISPLRSLSACLQNHLTGMFCMRSYHMFKTEFIFFNPPQTCFVSYTSSCHSRSFREVILDSTFSPISLLSILLSIYNDNNLFLFLQEKLKTCKPEIHSSSFNVHFTYLVCFSKSDEFTLSG